jgi:hypothetical protein
MFKCTLLIILMSHVSASDVGIKFFNVYTTNESTSAVMSLLQSSNFSAVYNEHLYGSGNHSNSTVSLVRSTCDMATDAARGDIATTDNTVTANMLHHFNMNTAVVTTTDDESSDNIHRNIPNSRVGGRGGGRNSRTHPEPGVAIGFIFILFTFIIITIAFGVPYKNKRSINTDKMPSGTRETIYTPMMEHREPLLPTSASLKIENTVHTFKLNEFLLYSRREGLVV